MTILKNYNISAYSPLAVSHIKEAKGSNRWHLNLNQGAGSSVAHANFVRQVASGQLVPLFNNPSSKAAKSSLQLLDVSSVLPNITLSSRLQQLNLFKAKPLNSYASIAYTRLAFSLRKQLVYIPKKGSQTSNPNIISYSFPAKGFNNYATKYNTVNNVNKLIINNVYKLLFNFFKSMYCLISKPVLITTPDKIKIQLFYFICIPKVITNKNLEANKKGALIGLKRNKLNNLAQSNLTKVYPKKFKLISTILSKFFNKPVELELIRLHQPYFDSNILVNFLALIINKKNIGACIHRLYNSNIINSSPAKAATSIRYTSNQATSGNISVRNTRLGHFNNWPQASIDYIYNPLINSNFVSLAHLSGLNIKISGRLMREPIIPRLTTKKFEKGFTAKGKINYSDVARFTNKNRKGAFTITVKSGQNF